MEYIVDSVPEFVNLTMSKPKRVQILSEASLVIGEGVDEKTPWVHIDIAPPAFNEGAPYGYNGFAGAEAGVGVATGAATEAATCVATGEATT